MARALVITPPLATFAGKVPKPVRAWKIEIGALPTGRKIKDYIRPPYSTSKKTRPRCRVQWWYGKHIGPQLGVSSSLGGGRRQKGETCQVKHSGRRITQARAGICPLPA